MVLYPNKLPESERVCSGICTFLQRCNDTTNQARQSNAGTADTKPAHTNAEKAKEA